MLYTTAQVAEQLQITPGRVRQLADALQMRERLGHIRVFTEADIERMRQRHTSPGPIPRTPKEGDE